MNFQVMPNISRYIFLLLKEARWNSTRNDFFRIFISYPLSSFNLYLSYIQSVLPLVWQTKLDTMQNKGKMIVLYILIFTFLGSRWQDVVASTPLNLVCSVKMHVSTDLNEIHVFRARLIM
jgi:hypothetical protein